MPQETKTFARIPISPEQARKIAGIAAYYGLPKERAIGVLATAAADLESLGDADMRRILEDAGKTYKESRTKKAPEVKVRKLKKHTATLIGK